MCSEASPFEIRVGDFVLCFAPSGKLAQLTARGLPLLHVGQHQFSVGENKKFNVSGWDECFPSIEAFEDCPLMGMVIGDIPEVSYGPDAVEQTWRVPGFRVTRLFEPATDGGLKVTFEAKNVSDDPRRYLWASHALFSLEGVREIVLPERRLRDLRLDGTSSKSFDRNSGPVQIIRDSVVLRLATDQPWWGIWLNRGGWPASAPAGFRCVGIEPTTTNSDCPADAVLQPGQTFVGTVSLQVSGR